MQEDEGTKKLKENKHEEGKRCGRCPQEEVQWGGVWTGVHIIIERVKSCEVPYYLSILPRVASRCSLHIRAL
jgi:hypothetical protein